MPAPELHFYAQRKLALELRDFYGRLIDGMRAERGKLRSGGDGMDEAGLKGTPPVEDTVAFYSGIVRVEADGTAKVDFEMPNFNGTVRVHGRRLVEGQARPRHRATSSSATRWRLPPPLRAS